MERLIDNQQLAEALGVSARTVDGWRSTKDGPDYVKVGGQVRYRQGDVDAWLQTILVVQGNTAGRQTAGPGWKDFVAQAITISDAHIYREDLWTAWLQYIQEERFEARDPAAWTGTIDPSVVNDLRPALSRELQTDFGADPHVIHGVRFSLAGEDLLYQGQKRARRLPAPPAISDDLTNHVGERFAIGLHGGGPIPTRIDEDGPVWREPTNADAQPREAVIDFGRTPLLAVYGDASGKTSLIRTLVHSIRSRRTSPKASPVVVVDINHSDELTAASGSLDADEDYYITSLSDISDRIKQLATILEPRLYPPPGEFTAQAAEPTLYLLIDNVDAIDDMAASGPSWRKGDPISAITTSPEHRRLWQPLMPFLRHAHRIGLRVITTHTAEDAHARGLTGNGLLSEMNNRRNQALTNHILLGSTHRARLGEHVFHDDLPCGAGYLVAANPRDSGFIQLAFS